MTDNEIIKVFKYCILNDGLNDCRNCSAYQDDKCTIPDLGQEILQLFDRQKAQIERLEKENAGQKAILEAIDNEMLPLPFETDFDKAIKTAKAEAIKEFAEKLKEKMTNAGKNTTYGDFKFGTIKSYEIDKLVKEMTETEE